MRRARALRVLAGAALITSCASQGAPPGGPPDKNPLVLVRVTPDSDALNVRPSAVIFRFDKVVSETPRSATSLGDLVIVSPSEGGVRVDWARSAIVVRPRKGWRANTAYTVTILPGLTDLHGNTLKTPLHVQFSTGSVIPHGAVRGVVFDWVAQQAINGARVEGMIGTDTTLRYIAVADSMGGFTLANLPPGPVRVRAYIDANHNRALDSRELWDSTSVALTDSARHDFYVFAHDSLGPQFSAVTPIDTLTVRLVFDRSIAPESGLDTTQLTVWAATDSARARPVRVVRVMPGGVYDSVATARKQFLRDSIAHADTSAAGRRARARTDSVREANVRDSISNAQIAAARARRDTARREPPPKPARPAPPKEFVIELATPLETGIGMRIEAKNVHGLSGGVRTSVRNFVYRPPPKDTTAAKRALRDTTAAKKP